MQHQQRMFPRWQQSTIAGFKRLLQWPGLHPTPIDKKRHVLPAILSKGAIADITMQSKSMLRTLIGIYRYRIEHFSQGKMIEFSESSGEIPGTTCLQGHMFLNGQI